MKVDMFYISVLLLSLVYFLGSALSADVKPESLGNCPECVNIRVGKAEYVYGPAGAPMDNPFFSIVDEDGSLLGYSANGDTEIVVKGDLDHTVENPLVALRIGDKGEFDECGAWLNSAFIDGEKVRGWYHAEAKCDYEVGQTYKSIAYCESNDGGITFDKSSYTKNQIITGTLPPTADRTVGNGDHSVILGDDGYYYLYFINWDEYGLCVARAPTSSGGVPGSWKKYYEGEWNEPGLGGNSTRIDGLVGSSIYKHKLGSLLSVGNGNGISLSFGTDPITFKKLAVPLLYAEGSQWDRTSSSTELIAYPAFVPTTGGTGPVDNTFWLYYTYLEPGAYFSQRYLVRRQVDISFQDSPISGPQVGVELSRYRAGVSTWVTTAVPISGNFSYNTSLGYMLTAEYDGTVPLYDCYIDAWKDYMISTVDCKINGMTFLRHMGWVYASKQPYTSAIYRCWNVNTLKHSVSKDTNCEGNGYMEYMLGWTLDK